MFLVPQAFNSIKAALLTYSKQLSQAWGPKGIRVNAVSPGVVRTNLWQSMIEQDRNSMYENVRKTLLVGHVGEPAEIARAYVFLMQEGYSTGQVVVVDGGAVLV